MSLEKVFVLSDTFDLVILGSGPSATRVATRCAQAKWKVAVVDPNPIGGTCALHGCNPKKVLVRAAELVDRAHRMAGNGANVGAPEISWSDLICFKRTFTEPVTENRRSSYTELGIEIIQGMPKFTGPSTVDVSGRLLQAKHILVATGAVPRSLSFPGTEYLTNSDQFLNLDYLPNRITFIGGGYIGFEFAHVAARAGAKVTILDQSELLTGFDRDLVRCLADCSQKVGIDVQSHTTVSSIERDDDGNFHLSTFGDTGEQTHETDLVVHSAGRVANVQGMNLEGAQIEYSEKGIHVNEYLQSTTNPAVYAAGDVVASNSPALTPIANYQGIVVSKNLLEGNLVKNEDPLVPKAVFSVPSLAAIGMTEAEAKEANIDVKINHDDWSHFSSMKKVGETHAMYKVLVDKLTDQIVGAHLLGPEAAELINVFALAMKLGATTADLKEMPFVFPTFTADLKSML